MSDYQKLKKLDEESLKKLQEGSGPVDECICHLFDIPEKKGLGASVKRFFGASGKKNKADTFAVGGKNYDNNNNKNNNNKNNINKNNNNKSIFVPFATGKGGKGIVVPFASGKGGKGLYSTKEVIKNKSGCTKCKCNKDNLVLKHSYAAIKIITPDASSICPCPSDCLPEKTRNMLNNVKVTVERVTIDPDTVDSEVDLNMSSSSDDKRVVNFTEEKVERIQNGVSEIFNRRCIGCHRCLCSTKSLSILSKQAIGKDHSNRVQKIFRESPLELYCVCIAEGSSEIILQKKAYEMGYQKYLIAGISAASVAYVVRKSYP